MSENAESVNQFWLETVGPKGWYLQSDTVDDAIRDRFSGLAEQALNGSLDGWTDTAQGSLALLILLDQFPRNLNRGSAKAFEADAKAREVARRAVAENQDMEISEPGRQFFYLPFEHSEDLSDQDWSIALFKARMTLADDVMYHVEQHRETIRRFGRFPYRNEALGRESTLDEKKYLDGGGYTPGKS